MILKNLKTVKEWEDYGLLEEIPEDRKEMVVSCYNTVNNLLIEYSLATAGTAAQEEFEALVLPLFYRITKVVDLTEAQVIEIYREFRHEHVNYVDSDRARLEKVVDDPELHLIKSFAEAKIRQFTQLKYLKTNNISLN